MCIVRRVTPLKISLHFLALLINLQGIGPYYIPPKAGAEHIKAFVCVYVRDVKCVSMCVCKSLQRIAECTRHRRWCANVVSSTLVGRRTSRQPCWQDHDAAPPAAPPPGGCGPGHQFPGFSSIVSAGA